MTTIGGMVSNAPKGVMHYNPSAAAPTAQPVRRAPAKAKGKPAPAKYDAIDAQFMVSAEELAKRQQVKAKTADKPWWQDTLGFTANLLSPLSVPMKLVNVGLEEGVKLLPDDWERAMSHPFGTGHAWWQDAGNFGAPLMGGIFGQDMAKTHDDQGVWERLAPRSSYGAGELYGNDSDVPGLTGLRNLLLDVEHDPLTYVTGGERLVAKGAEVGAELGRAGRGAEIASKGFDNAVEAYAKALESGDQATVAALSDAADQSASHLGQATQAHEAAASRYAQLDPTNLVHSPQTVGKRAAFISELAGRDPELVQRFQSEFTKGINRGFGRMSPEAREAVGMADRGLRMVGQYRIPGTGRLVQGSGVVGSALKGGASKVGEFLPETLRNIRTPETVAEARQMLRSKSTSPKDFQLANDYIRVVNDIKVGSGEMGMRGANEINRKWKSTFKKLTGSQRDALRVEAEQGTAPNAVNDMMKQLAEIHEKITGRPYEDFSSINPDQYLPHIQTKKWAKFVKDNPENPAVQAYKDVTEFRTSDALHTSGYVDRARQLRLAPGEVSKEIPLGVGPGGRKLRLDGNSIDDLNKGLADAFPEFNGNFYETDIDKIFQTYNDALARDAGSRLAWNKLADSASPYGHRVEGALADSVDRMNEALGLQSKEARLRKLVEDRGGNFTPGERLEVPARPLAPGTKADRDMLSHWSNYADDLQAALTAGDTKEIYRLTDEAEKLALPRSGVEILGKNEHAADGFTWAKIGDTLTQVPDASLARGPAGDIPAEHLGIITPRVNERATRDLTSWANSGAPTTFAGQAQHEGRVLREQMIAQMRDMQTNAYTGLKDEVSAASARIKSLREAADEYVQQIKGLGKVDRNNAVEVTRLRETVDKNIVDLTNEIKQRNSVWKGKGTREANKIDKELNRQLRVLKEHSANLDRKLNELPADIRREIKWRREQLFKPVDDARAQVRSAEASFKATESLPYTPEQITWATETELAGRKATGAASATAESLRDDYRKAVTKLEGLRNKLSTKKLTEESVAKIQAQIAKQGEKVQSILDQARAAQAAGTHVAKTPRPSLPVADRARAQEILSNVADYEKRLNEHLAPHQAKLDQTIENVHRQPEALVYNRDKSARYFHDELGRTASQTSPRPDVFQGRRVEPVTTPPQRGASVVDVPGYTQPGLPEPDINPMATMRAIPEGIGGARLRRRAAGGVSAAGEVIIGTHGVQPPPQRLEETALKDLERIAQAPSETQLGRYAQNTREAIPIAEANLPTRIANEQAAAATANEIGRLTDVLPREAAMQGAHLNAAALHGLDPLATELSGEVGARTVLRKLRDQYKAMPLGARKLDIEAAIKDLETVTANNHLLDPATRDATNTLLAQFASDVERTAANKEVLSALGKMARDARSGQLKDQYLAGLADGWSGIHKGAVQRGDTIMADKLRNMLLRAERSLDDPKAFGRVFNEATNVFKTYATLSPSFHVRNAISGIFMNAADGVSLTNQLDGWRLTRAYRNAENGGEKWLLQQPEEIQEAFRTMAASGGGGRYAEAGFAGAHDNKTLNKVTRNRATLASQRAGERVEQSLRLGMALDSVRRGESIHQGLERIAHIHFDYSDLSKMDETMKRFVPFWTFMSRNLPLQMQMVYTNPRAYSEYGHFKRNVGEPNAPFTPSYWSDTGAFNTGATIAGMPMYLQPDLGIDQAQTQLKQIKDLLGGDYGGALSQLNPVALAPMEFAFKKDLYRDRTFTDADYSKAGGPIGTAIGALARLVPGQTKQVNGETLVSDNFMSVLTSLIPPISQASRLAPQATGQLSDTDRQIEGVLRYLGVPARTLSPKQQQVEQRNQYYDALDAISTNKKLQRRAAA